MWGYLDESERESFQAAVAFLKNRLQDASVVEWAVELKPHQRVERLAIEHLLEGSEANNLIEPWQSVWRLIEESWSTVPVEDNAKFSGIYEVKERIKRGERSGALVKKITELVHPHLEIKNLSAWRKPSATKLKRPKTIHQLISPKLTSGDLIDPKMLKLDLIDEIEFIKSLALSIESSMNYGLDLAKRLGWSEQSGMWQLGGLTRVVYVSSDSNDLNNSEPDKYHRGIAPSVKLLTSLLSRLGELNVSEAKYFLDKWRLRPSPLMDRLWAAIASSPDLVEADEVSEFLSRLNSQLSWDIHSYPEVAELRISRFRDLDGKSQLKIASKIMKGPPRTYFKNKVDEERKAEASLYYSLRELRRIEIAGGELPPVERFFLRANIDRFDSLLSMEINSGFPQEVKVESYSPEPDDTYDQLRGLERLNQLEKSLSEGRRGWNDEPAESANSWIQRSNNACLVLHDFEAAGGQIDKFHRLLDRVFWAHKKRNIESASADSTSEIKTQLRLALGLIRRLSDATLKRVINGLSEWFSAWGREVIYSDVGFECWKRVWPIAEDETNSSYNNIEQQELSVSVAHDEPLVTDTLNTPAGKLTGVLLDYLSSLDDNQKPFKPGSKERETRDILINAKGRSGVIVRYRLSEYLPYFLNADKEWTEKYLINPLLENTDNSVALWQALAYRTHGPKVLKVIGKEMLERAGDQRLGRESRERLVFSLVIEIMHAYKEKREPVIPPASIQQMLRTVEDEVRAFAAGTIQQFVREISAKENNPAEIFLSCAYPLLRDIWPQERSLATPGVSAAFADLPATSRGAFERAVDTLEPYLVPFDCWSLLDFGLFGEQNELSKVIDDENKAMALLKLLNLTIGTSQGSVVPYDLTDALEQVKTVSPDLIKNQIYRRLSTLARR